MASNGCRVRGARCRVLCGVLGAWVLGAWVPGARVLAQAPVPAEQLTFQQAVDLAVAKNASVAVATAGILRAEGLLAQAHAATRLQVTGNVTTTTLNESVEFSGSTVTPRNQVTGALTVDMPIVAAGAWARRAQAADNRQVAELAEAETGREVAMATADAYLSIIAQRRVVDANARARDTARAHFDLATELEQRGSGSHLNALRAAQQVTLDERLVESARLALYRAQEALGVLVMAEGPVDAADEPGFEAPAEPGFRVDLKLFSEQARAAERVVHDSARDRWPSLDAIFLPQTIYPTPFFSNANSWRFLLQASVPIFDSGTRTALKVQRQAGLDVARATLAGAVTRASSQVRAAREAVASGARSLASARAEAEQAQEVVRIVNVSFRAGAATNIEVIDAERGARDADTAVAVAEDALRRARLELLIALGRFP